MQWHRILCIAKRTAPMRCRSRLGWRCSSVSRPFQSWNRSILTEIYSLPPRLPRSLLATTTAPAVYGRRESSILRLNLRLHL
jgi:hypothetical protein